MNWKTASILIFQSAALAQLSAQSVHKSLRTGDAAYQKAHYDEAERAYRVAADLDMGNEQAVYNLGNAMFQQGKFPEAAQRFDQLARKTQNPAWKADALHNLGDALMKMRKFGEAVDAYKQSLRIRPGDEGTKHNLQMALKKRKEEMQKQQQQQQQPQQQNNNQKQDSTQQNQNQPEQQQPGQPSQNQQNQTPQKPTPDEQEQAAQKVKKMKQEEINRLLETAIEPEDRKNARKYRAADQQHKPANKKDW